MTRETKIGLLVGLAFIIVIGILLSDHFRNAMEPPQANLTNVGNIVAAANSAPGASAPPLTRVTEQDNTPRQPVPTPREITPPRSPVTPGNPPLADAHPSPDAPSQQQQAPTPPLIVHPQSQETAGADGPGLDKLQRAARERGLEIVPVNNNNGGTPTAVNPVPAQKAYVAQAGDTLGQIAYKLLGSSNRGNQQVIIDANPSLKGNPDLIVAGRTYVIPVISPAARAAEQPQTPQAAAPREPAPTPAGAVYVVRSGDTLWGIANNQLDDPSAVDAIKELNKNVLKGQNHDVIRVGMKLRLPGRPVASAD